MARPMLVRIFVDELPIIWYLEVGYYMLFNKDFAGLPMDVWGPLNPYDTVFWKKGKTG